MLCDFNVADGRKTRPKRGQSQVRRECSPTAQDVVTNVKTPISANATELLRVITDSANSRGYVHQSVDISRSSTEPGGHYDNDEQHTGPASGLAFLQQAVQHIQRTNEPQRSANSGHLATTSASIFTSGDMPTPASIASNFEMPNNEESRRLLSRYFEYATPTYRFFHRPTVEIWAKQLLDETNQVSSSPNSLSPAKEAAVYLTWAQALEYHDPRTQRTNKR